MSDIAYQNKDVTAKVMAETLKGKSLAAFGRGNTKGKRRGQRRGDTGSDSG